MNNPIASAIKQICDDKGVPQEQVVEALEAALAAAYRKDFGEKHQNVKVEFDIKTGNSRVFDVKNVVEDVEEEEEDLEDKKEEEEEGKKRFNPKTDIMISQAITTHPNVVLGDEIRTELTVPADYGRMAAQTAKQVIIQKIREAERMLLFQTFKDKEGTIVTGTVQRREEYKVFVDFGKVTAILPSSEQMPRERYAPGDRIKVYVVSVQITSRGPEVLISRTHPGMIKEIFEAEIPEVANGSIEIKGIAREPGIRAKVAVLSHHENIDPIGSCIGQRGSRIQTIISELGGEKVDIILYDEDPEQFITHALSPAKMSKITLDESTHIAHVLVPDDQLSLAIGKMGQNVRLASHLTGWSIEVRGDEKIKEPKEPEEIEVSDEQTEQTEEEPQKSDS